MIQTKIEDQINYQYSEVGRELVGNFSSDSIVVVAVESSRKLRNVETEWREFEESRCCRVMERMKFCKRDLMRLCA